MSRVTVTLRPVGRGGWAPLVLSYDPQRRSELPTPLDFKRGQTVQIMGQTFKVSRVTA